MKDTDFIVYLETLYETTDVECKAAQGRDGKGEVPASIWENYSAMANTDGGDIYLGLEETEDHHFVIKGIKDVQKVRKQFWDTINSTQKVSKNILTDSDVEILSVHSNSILHIHVPRARRQDRPIHLKENPFGNTYIRRHEGDYRADDETVKRMIAEAVEDSRDERLLTNSGISDLNMDTIKAYRNRFATIKPSSPWIDLSNEEFLIQIGALGMERQTGKIALRVAGLLMFGNYNSIRDFFPNYMLDYQEHPESRVESRWIDRIVPDDTWSGNLYDFYHKVYRKLTADLKIPFKLQEETRIDDTPVHQAIREALTNTLIHADYTGRVSIRIIKSPDMFYFCNPGLMRVTVEQALAGGISDCRNRYIQSLFRYVGLADQAGSGIPSILKTWQSQHWRSPLLVEDSEYDRTLLTLRTISLLPEESVKHLENLLGDMFHQLSELQRIALITAEAEGHVSHARIKQLCSVHSKDISDMLADLVKEGYLEKQGATRGSIYYLTKAKKAPFYGLDLFKNSPDLTSNSPDLTSISPDLTSNSPDLISNANLLTELIKPKLAEWHYNEMPRKLDAVKMQELILFLCKERWLSLKELSQVLEREEKSLQDQYLTPMLAKKVLKLKYPDSRNHPAQAYCANT